MTEEKDEDVTVDSLVVPVSTLTRWFLYDAGIGDSAAITEALNLFPVSSEGMEMEMKDSAMRAAATAPYVGLIRFISALNAKVLREIQAEYLKKNMPEHSSHIEAEGAEMESMYYRTSYVAVYAALSSALGLGILVNPGADTTIVGVNEVQ